MGLFSGIKDAASGLAGGFLGFGGANAAGKASGAQVDAIRKAIEEYRAGYKGQQDLYNPYINAGTQGLENLNALNSGDYSAFMNSPDYLYARREGLRGINASAAGMGNLYSGSRGNALARYASGLATQNLGNYRNALGQQIGIGQYGTTGTSNALADMTHGVAGAQMGIGDARAGGYIGAANSYGNAAGNLLNFGSSLFGGGSLR